MSVRPPSDQLMQWAAVGSRISGFHHDSASKLQSLMMALDEATELVDENPADAKRALETATTALRELHQLLTDNRALAKAPQRRPMKVSELVTRAGARHGVKVRGELGDATVYVAPASMIHALSMLCDLIAGTQQGMRTVDVSVTPGADRLVVSIAGTPPAESTLDVITVATWLVEREGGELFSAPHGFQVHVPTIERSAAAKP